METQTKESLLERITHLTVLIELVETIWVDSSKGQIEVSNIIKKGDDIDYTTNVIEYKLKSHRLIVKNSNNDSIVISDLPRHKTIFKK